MAQDVYSIGVVLYEIANWECFLIWDGRILDYNIGGRSIIKKNPKKQDPGRARS